MTQLSIYPPGSHRPEATLTDAAAITGRLNGLGIEFEQWPVDRALPADAGQEQVLAAYADEIGRLDARYGFNAVDVVGLTPDHPDAAALRGKFLAEHTHADFEVRFFIAGRGLFYLHIDDTVYLLLCEAGDLVSVPANTRHWFDMGSRPDFRCIRFFTAAQGWVGEFTGSDIAGRYPDFDRYTTRQA